MMTPVRRVKHAVSSEGNFLGKDGFVVPKNFEEFVARFPGYIMRWVGLAVRYPLVQCKDDTLDWASELTLRLMSPADVIARFDPARSNGATRTNFFSYVDLCLRNKFRNLLAKQSKDAVRDVARYETNEILAPQDQDTSLEDSEEYAHRRSSKLQESVQRNGKQEEDRQLVAAFHAFVTLHDTSVIPLMDAIAVYGTLSEAARSLRLSSRRFISDLNRLRVLRECFEKGDVPLPRRKPYRLKRELLRAS